MKRRARPKRATSCAVESHARSTSPRLAQRGTECTEVRDQLERRARHNSDQVARSRRPRQVAALRGSRQEWKHAAVPTAHLRAINEGGAILSGSCARFTRCVARFSWAPGDTALADAPPAGTEAAPPRRAKTARSMRSVAVARMTFHESKDESRLDVAKHSARIERDFAAPIDERSMIPFGARRDLVRHCIHRSIHASRRSEAFCSDATHDSAFAHPWGAWEQPLCDSA